MRMTLAALVFTLAQAAPAPPAISVTAKARSLQPGEVVALTIATAEPASAVHVRAFDHDAQPFRVDPKTWRVLVGIDLETAPRAYLAAIAADTAAGPLHSTYSIVVKPKTFDTRTLTVDDAFVNPPASVTKRIEDEAVLLSSLWAHVTPERLWTSPFIRPVAEAANSAFGKRSVFNGQARSPHTGADFESPAGTPVHAPSEGRVVVARELYYTGNTVILDHGLGLYSLFAHFSEIDVHDKDLVSQGQVLGKVGATGRVTGPHLHWAIRLNGARVDPLSLIVAVEGEGPARR